MKTLTQEENEKINDLSDEVFGNMRATMIIRDKTSNVLLKIIMNEQLKKLAEIESVLTAIITQENKND